MYLLYDSGVPLAFRSQASRHSRDASGDSMSKGRPIASTSSGGFPTSIRLYVPTQNLLMMGVGPHHPKVGSRTTESMIFPGSVERRNAPRTGRRTKDPVLLPGPDGAHTIEDTTSTIVTALREWSTAGRSDCAVARKALPIAVLLYRAIFCTRLLECVRRNARPLRSRPSKLPERCFKPTRRRS